MTLHGVYTIALTPFTDEGDLDEESIGSLSEFYVDARVHGLTILGIMGEAHKLSDVRFPAPPLDEETLRELEDLLGVLGLAG